MRVSTMNEYEYDKFFNFFLKKFGQSYDCTPVSNEAIEHYKIKLPEQLFTYWIQFGWCGYGQGIYWMVNPKKYENILEDWLDGTVFEDRDDLSVISRNAFGKLYVWGKGKGEVMNINPATNIISYFPENDGRSFSAENEDEYMRRFWGMSKKDFIDYEDDNEEPLFDRALKKLGQLRSDEIYGFKLHRALGGGHKLDNLDVMKLEAYHDIAQQLGEKQIVVIKTV